MPTLMSDYTERENSPYIPSEAVAHIRRGEGQPTLCGSPFGMGFIVTEGEDPGAPWPYPSWCVVCADLQYGDEDSSEQSAELMR